MPSRSKAQHALMLMAAAGKSRKVPVEIAREFLAADRATGKYQPRKKGKK